MSETARRLTSGSVVFSSESDAADARASGSGESLATMASSCARMAVTAVFNASMKAAKKARAKEKKAANDELDQALAELSVQ